MAKTMERFGLRQIKIQLNTHNGSSFAQQYNKTCIFFIKSENLEDLRKEFLDKQPEVLAFLKQVFSKAEARKWEKTTLEITLGSHQ